MDRTQVRGRSAYIEILVAGAALAGWFLVITTVMDQIPDAALVAGTTLVALVFAAAFHGVPKFDPMKRRLLVQAVLGGAMALGAAPLLALWQRASDAPSGSETLLFTTTAWGVLGALGALASRKDSARWVRGAGALFALAGTAALLANWERPSSFSPMVKFPAAETTMLVAGVLFVAGSWVLAHVLRESPARQVVVPALAGALLVALVGLSFGGPGRPEVWRVIWPQAVLLGAIEAAIAITWTRLVASRGVPSASAALFIPPLAITCLSIAEKATGQYGPDPVLWPAALTGVALAAIGAAAVWWTPRPAGDGCPTGRSVRVTGLATTGVAVAVALASLATPAFRAMSEGVLADNTVYKVSWTMSGAESAAGWLPLVAALLLLAMWLEGPARASRQGVLALGAAFALVAYPLLAATPLRTWTTWIPAEVQQAYGTEYARMVTVPVHDAVRVAAIGLCALACVVALWSAVRCARGSARASGRTEVIG